MRKITDPRGLQNVERTTKPTHTHIGQSHWSVPKHPQRDTHFTASNQRAQSNTSNSTTRELQKAVPWNKPRGTKGELWEVFAQNQHLKPRFACCVHLRDSLVYYSWHAANSAGHKVIFVQIIKIKVNDPVEVGISIIPLEKSQGGTKRTMGMRQKGYRLGLWLKGGSAELGFDAYPSSMHIVCVFFLCSFQFPPTVQKHTVW